MSSSRISLHECSFSVRLPILSHTTPQLSPEKIAVHAAATPTLDHSHAYTGSAILVLLTIKLPQSSTEHFQQHNLIHDIADPRIFLTPKKSSSKDAASSSFSSLSSSNLTKALTISNNDTHSDGNLATETVHNKSVPSFSYKSNSSPVEKIRLPVLSESSWCTPKTTASTVVSQNQQSKVLIKAVWVLVRAPPERRIDLEGLHELSVELRERTSTATSSNKSINSAVSATIYRASRLFGRVSSIHSQKDITILSPLSIESEILSIGQSIDRPYIKVVVKNITQDAKIGMTEPFFHLNNCKRISRRKSVTLVEPNTGVMKELDKLFKPVPLCTENYHQQNDNQSEINDRLDEFITDAKKRKWINNTSSSKRITEKSDHDNKNDNRNDHGVAFPEFNPSSPPVAFLNPREVFVFVFRIEKRLQQQDNSEHSRKNNDEKSSFIRTKTKYKGIISNKLKSNSKSNATNLSTSSGSKRSMDTTSSNSSVNEQENMEMIDRLMFDLRNALSTGDVIQTDISIAWSCSRETDAPVPDAPPLRRELSAGGVLATRGKRAMVAVCTTFVEWRPVSLLDGIVVSVSGSNIIHVGKTVFIKISIANRTGQPVNFVKVLLQQHSDEDDYKDEHATKSDEDVKESNLPTKDEEEGLEEPGLLALRTAVSVGKIGSGDETQIRVPCVALRAGMVKLGKVCVLCEVEGGKVIRKWVTENEFKTMAIFVDGDQRLDTQTLESLTAR